MSKQAQQLLLPLLLMFFILFFLPTANAQVLISGIMINPEGPDAQKEWVELYNPADEPFEGICTLVFGNGAQEQDWTQQWEGAISMRAHSYLLIGEDLVEQIDELASLSIQNGPDALKIECGEQSDFVGWGQLAFSEYFEGAPALTPDESFVLSRKWASLEDGTYIIDTQNNSNDFESTNRSAHFAQEQQNDIEIIIEIENIPPTIRAVENCTDDMDEEGIQILPSLHGLYNQTVISCDIEADDVNNDSIYFRVELLKNGEVVQQSNSSSLAIDQSHRAGQYRLKIHAYDQYGEGNSWEIPFEYISSIGILIDPASLHWKQAIPGKTLDMKQVNIINTGNIPINLTLYETMDQVSFTYSWFDEYGNIEEYTKMKSSLLHNKNALLGLQPSIDDKIGSSSLQGVIAIIVDAQ